MLPYRSSITWAFAIGNALLAVVMLAGVFGGLGTRWWVVDVPSVGVAGLLLLSSFGLARATRWAATALRACALVELCVGLLAIAALGVSAAYFGGVHGELGRSGLMTFILGMTLLLPYLIVYPSVQLLWLHRQQQYAQPS
jgi:hypothetical protein